MRSNSQRKKISLIEKIESLPVEKLLEVEDFVDFLYLKKGQHLTQAAKKLSETSFQKIWDNPEDSEYDKL